MCHCLYFFSLYNSKIKFHCLLFTGNPISFGIVYVTCGYQSCLNESLWKDQSSFVHTPMNRTLQQNHRQINPVLFFTTSIAGSDGIRSGTTPSTTTRSQSPPTMSSLHDLQQQSVRINVRIPSHHLSFTDPTKSKLNSLNQKISKFLDKIEIHFAQTPNVYNRFLDILDAFKSQE